MNMHFAVPRQDDLLRFLLVAIPAVTLAGYFVLPGWLNAGVVLLYIAAICALFRPAVRERGAVLLRTAEMRWMLFALAAPLLAVTIVAIGHGELQPRRFEGPSRLLLAGVVLLVLAAQRIDFTRTAWGVFPLSIALCAAWLMHPGASAHFWGGERNRAATVFMDPIALSYQSVVFAFMCAFLLPRARSKAGQLGLAAGAALGLVVSLQTQSRTGWALALVLGALLAWHAARERKASVAGPLLLMAGLVVAAYLLSPNVHSRVALSLQEVHQYTNGGSTDTSFGLRVSLSRVNLTLFSQRPLLGWGYTSQPDILTIPAVREVYTADFISAWQTGGHNEYLQSMMRMGIVGLLSRLLLFLVPFVIFARAALSGDAARARNGFLGLCVVIGYMSCGVTQEVLNLSYSSSLYALLVSLLAAGVLSEPLPGPQVARVAAGNADSPARLT